MAQTHRKKRRRRTSPARRAAKIFYGILVVISALIVTLFCVYKLLAKEPEMAAEPTPEPAQPGTSAEPTTGRQRKPYTYTFLLVAKDQVGSNADTMIVCTYDTVAQTVGMVSIPRDTLVESGKLNAVYQQGIEVLRDTISLVSCIGSSPFSPIAALQVQWQYTAIRCSIYKTRGPQRSRCRSGPPSAVLPCI